MVQPLWKHTPLIYSQALSESMKCDVYLKLENLQPSQSFKYRGMSHVAQIVKKKCNDPHLIIASGGNAGYAVACAANAIGARSTIFLPSGLDTHFLERLRLEGTNLVIGGKEYSEVLRTAQEAAAADENGIEISAYDDVDLWEGHASMVHEISKDLAVKPDAIFCSVGGGGLLAGVMVGCKQVNWDDVPIVALETMGADCFYYSIQANRQPRLSKSSGPPLREGISLFDDAATNVRLARLPAITSAASSLGASSPAPGSVKMALERKGGVYCVLVPDSLSKETALNFAEDHKFLVELACSTALVPAYKPQIFDAICPPTGNKSRTVVFIVCGGSKISLQEMAKYHNATNLSIDPWKVWVEGQLLELRK